MLKFAKLILFPGGTSDPGWPLEIWVSQPPAWGTACISCFPTGSLCGDGTSACYLLPVFDTVFVRRKNRCQGLGTAMLRDFCDTFREDEALGISCPISPAMYKVLRQFLLTCPGERGRLWEVEPPGAWGQRVNIWLKICLQEAGLQDGEWDGHLLRGSTVHPEASEEDTNTPRQTSRGDGPTPFHHGESHKSAYLKEDNGIRSLHPPE
ncbi:hypothetical protein A6R68_01268 [Neotoma lepida]|uniref:Uncharacterized protein n=1 Tax=Neotoma lepida TaxID=56216 RepID=A0A1A6GW62_NEOLE|nr:hypothetical protein A6R68_01268 [Neotoma lepida]